MYTIGREDVPLVEFITYVPVFTRMPGESYQLMKVFQAACHKKQENT